MMTPANCQFYEELLSALEDREEELLALGDKRTMQDDRELYDVRDSMEFCIAYIAEYDC